MEQGLSDSYQLIKNNNFEVYINDEIKNKEIWLIEISSRIDLEKFVETHSMAYLYYKLTPCDITSNNLELLTAPIFIKKNKVETKPYSYYAPVSKNLEELINRHLELVNKEFSTQIDSICLSIGAGNMSKSLKSNKLKLDWLKVEI